MEQRKHVLLAARLRRDIQAGRYGTEGGLPSISALVQSSGYARGTVNSALTLLEGEGLIEKRDSGYYVCRVLYPMVGYMPPVAERMQAVGRQGYIKNVGYVTRGILPEYLADKVRINRDLQAVLQSCLLGETREGREMPTQFSRYYYLLSVSRHQFEAMQVDARFDPVEINGPAKVERYDEIVSRLPTQEECSTLDVPFGSPVLVCLSVVRDLDHNVLLVQEDVFVSRVVFSYHYSFDNRPAGKE